jgi:hypothetical protein
MGFFVRPRPPDSPMTEVMGCWGHRTFAFPILDGAPF